MIKLLRQFFCRHECSVKALCRLSDDRVVCPCRRCGKVLKATHGLALPAKLVE